MSWYTYAYGESYCDKCGEYRVVRRQRQDADYGIYCKKCWICVKPAKNLKEMLTSAFYQHGECKEKHKTAKAAFKCMKSLKSLKAEAKGVRTIFYNRGDNAY